MVLARETSQFRPLATMDSMTSSADGELARKAEQFLSAHHAEHPLLLPNAWDAASARAVANAGFAAVATSSRAIAEVLGEPDDDSADPEVVFSFTARIARAVSVPVTADLLTARHNEIVTALAAGASMDDL